MTGLSITDGAVTIPLGLVSQSEAEALLAARLGPDRLAAEPVATAQLIALCARLPLALAITAARAAANPAGAARIVRGPDEQRARPPRCLRHRRPDN